MSIRYTCGCGADIRLPRTSAGRKAKCKSCGAVFRIPQSSDLPAAAPDDRPARRLTAPAPAPPSAREAAEPGALLDDLAHSESRAAGEPVVLDLSEPDEPSGRYTGPAPRAANESPQVGFGSPDEDRDWILDPERSFWTDLAASFFFFLEPANLVTFVALSVVSILPYYVPILGCFFGLCVGWLIDAYISVFLLATVLETASGEDHLPAVWVNSVWDDLIVPAFQLALTKLFVLLPAIALACFGWSSIWGLGFGVFNAKAIWEQVGVVRGVAILALIGGFFWPAVVLAVAIGRTFAGLWPHVIVRTALSAPLAYLAICAAIVMADLLSAVPSSPQFASAVGAISPTSALGLHIAGQVLAFYSSIVAMRAIGLYYRHYKRRLPWVAE